MPDYKIRDLIDCSHYLPTIAEWMWQEWDRKRGWTPQQSLEECQKWLQRDAIPYAVAAVRRDKIIGTMCLHPRDLEERPDLSPWMACQYVIPEARGRAVAKDLSAALEEKARQLNFRNLYMWTEHNPAIYRRYGYTYLFKTQYYGLPITVLIKNLGA